LKKIWKYWTTRNENNVSYSRPMLPIGINNFQHQFLAILDSGADRTVIPYGIALQLNLFQFFTSRGFTRGVEGKKIISYFCKVKKITLFHENKIFVEFKDVEIQIPLSSLTIPLLGRDIVFKKFKVTFIEKRKEIILEK